MNNKVKKSERLEFNFICSSCKQAKEFTDNDEYKCRCGLNSIFKTKPKCKYFKRHPKYITCDGVPKIRSHYKNGISTKIRYIRGKFMEV